MFSYLAFAWDRSSPLSARVAKDLLQRLALTSRRWCTVFNSEGLRICCSDLRPRSCDAYALANRGVVLGTVFKRTSSLADPIATLNERDSEEILHSGGRELVQHYWGRYVAFLTTDRPGSLRIIRDPTGALPCFSTEFQGVRIYFSWVEDVIALGALTFSINWSFIASYLCHSHLQNYHSGIQQVSELQPGECLETHRDGSTQRLLYWDPVKIAADPIEREKAAIEAIRTATQSCVSSWASLYSNLILLLSGGLDSSIVLSCLRRAASHPHVTCLNYFAESTDTDERKFARVAAAGSGFELIEAREGITAAALESLRDIPRTAVPVSYLYYLAQSQSQDRLAREKHAAAIFQGAGGDQIFFQSPLALGVADHARRYGLSSELVRVALNVARAEQLSLWTVLRSAIVHGLLRRRADPLMDVGRYVTLVSDEVVASARRDPGLIHPWLRTAKNVPEGKLQHILMMAVLHDFYDPLAAPYGPERVRPLASQPLIETCLRVPTYVLTAGGRDRAATRLAFTGEVPLTILSRRSKGGIDQLVQRLFTRNIGFVREFMLDGVLIKENLLNRQKIEALLANRGMMGPEVGELVARHLSTEAWVRAWINPPKESALPYQDKLHAVQPTA